MLNRVLEPEVMNTSDEAIDYNQMDHRQVNRLFVDDFLSAFSELSDPAHQPWKVFDAGTGTALIPIELLQRGFPAIVTASDLADEMLLVAQKNVAAKGLDDSIKLTLSDCKELQEDNNTYDAVMSNSILHHIPDPRQVLKELWRILKPGGLFFIRDLFRPNDVGELERIVRMYAGDANQHQQQMFRDSLHAALTVVEVSDLIRELRLPEDAVRATSDRHWTIQCQKSL